ncbi:tRNA (adenine(22)-N(1))-methyltransferase [Paraclostridium sordellii]|uniref:SAM-dependent methyltransferase n=1 Tax=Paraclostridium sordellii TaxID=1505 RepID=A0A0C7JGH9_PARSO|nr:class I SAM-dependent methyltransferase [Paeniclostridium sordellii]QYE99271.1 class I SAM-dependent methyltransferase [Paeniclostridium sordellii]CEN78072.1 SAM-dependent methyltransferase [[Clostridium] sordellii] [Paeniclostridium sordellii]CEO26952.1 SAM-dependent methyltransferase [[Clostridium] sordellii] [Paeniclostridium sordellii]CEP43066.1 SAM-dependent methyltransferase [[Clostridium] sordellii] [Paeniclostridium sordellii]CEQ03159.1 SAM-dependent methyltransferase [[Clostridium]
MKLTDRLLKIASLVGENKKIADIGTDHGYIPVYLLNNNKIDYAILADVNKGPLENARKEVKHNKLENKVDLRLGSGLEVLKINEVDEIIIAGMGGILISELLNVKKDVSQSVEKLILQPMQAQSELRKYLYNNGYEIINEVLVKEDFRIYEIIETKYTGKDTVVTDDIYYEVGKKLIENKDDLLEEFLIKKINAYKGLLDKLDGKIGEGIERKRIETMEKIEKLKGLI